MATAPLRTITIRPSKAPNLPMAPGDYAPQFHEQFSNALRLYFAQIDNANAAVFGVNGGQYLENPHIGAFSDADQYALGDDIPTQVAWNGLDSISGFTLDPSGYAKADQSGVYKIDYSLQFANTDNTSHDVFVWLQVNGDFVTNSSSRFTIPARKSAGVFSFIVGYSSITFEIQKDDEIRLWWATEKAYNPVGPVAGVYMEALAAQTSPYVRPANPSAVGSIIFVSRLPA
jgi:hypothetical protein